MPSFRPAKPLAEIFEIQNPHLFLFELKGHISNKMYVTHQQLTNAEQVFEWLAGIGSAIVGEGFISLFDQYLTPINFPVICDALSKMGGVRLRDLLSEAWSIYTRGKEPITMDDFLSISVRRFNTRELMDRFDQIGDEVMKDIEHQYAVGKVWAIEYAKLHRDEFEPIKTHD